MNTDMNEFRLDEFRLAKLAREIAMSIRPVPAILQDYGLDETAFYEITKNAFFIRAKEQFALEWNSALSVNERVKLISASFLEQALPKLGGRMMGDEPLAAATDVAKLFARNAGLGDIKAEQKNNERFQITINLGADKEIYDKAVTIESAAPLAQAVSQVQAPPEACIEWQEPAKVESAKVEPAKVEPAAGGVVGVLPARKAAPPKPAKVAPPPPPPLPAKQASAGSNSAEPSNTEPSSPDALPWPLKAEHKRQTGVCLVNTCARATATKTSRGLCVTHYKHFLTMRDRARQ